MKKIITLILKPYAAILFLENKVAGAILFFLTLLHPIVGLSGLFALISTILFAEFAKMRQVYLEHGFYLYNSLLVGFGIGYLFGLTFTTLIFIFLLSVLTFLTSFSISMLFTKWRIPTLSLPFSLVMAIGYLASFNYLKLHSYYYKYKSSFLSINFYYKFHLPFLYNSFIGAYLKALGTIFFLPYPLAGAIMAAIMLIISPVLFSLSFFGFFIGVATHALLIGSWIGALHDSYAFNYILVAMALGGIFLLPLLKNYLYALVAVAISVVFVDATRVFFNYYALPVFTLPFNAVVMIILFLLHAIKYEGINYVIKETPESSLAYYLQRFFRFGPKVPNIALPFSGKWSVYQAFHGKWTHKGAWRYAYDFYIEKEGKSYKNEGLFLEDYYCFGESVLSPVQGYVVALRSDLPDNPIGVVDRINNWGNYIILRSVDGFYVEISHLMKDSIVVKEGDYVHMGQIIAKCGNSGYSPQPHIHIQVQKEGFLGSATIPFRFLLYKQNSRLSFNALPKEQEEIEALLPNLNMQMRFAFVLDEVFEYDYFESGEYKKTLQWSVHMNHLGEFYFSDGVNKLFFYTSSMFFYFYHYEGKESVLKELFKLAPRIPLTMDKELRYNDYLPIYLIEPKWKQFIIEMISSFKPNYYKRNFNYILKQLHLESQFGKIDFSINQKGFERIEYGNILLKRKK